MKIIWQLAALAALTSMSGGARAAQRHDWDDYKSGARKELQALEARIDAIESDAAKDGAEARKRATAEVSQLRSLRFDVDRDLRKLERAAKKDRDVLRARIDEGLRKLEKAVRDTRKKIGLHVQPSGLA